MPKIWEIDAPKFQWNCEVTVNSPANLLHGRTVTITDVHGSIACALDSDNYETFVQVPQGVLWIYTVILKGVRYQVSEHELRG